MNDDYIILTKQGAGVTSEYVDTTGPSTGPDHRADTLVNIVCDMLEKSNGHAYVSSSAQPVDCKCGGASDTYGNPTKILDASGNEISAEACLLTGGDVNNHLRYGNVNSNKPNWRVLGVYKVLMEDGQYHLSAKMITSGAV